LLLAAPGLSAAAEETNWTVLTVARNGNWGIGRAITQGEAIVAANDFEEAESSVLDRLIVLRELYGPDFPVCQHLLQIDARGALTTFKARRLEGGKALPTSLD
jgi:hypothetical protein